MYNDEKYIKVCLYSIVNQSYKDIELIVVNDGSKDNSLQIVQEFAKKDKRIKIINKENGGLSSARNTGIENSTGELLMFVDADDELEQDAIENLYIAINKGNSDISVGAATVIYDTHLELKENDDWYFSIRYSGIFNITDKLINDIHCSAWGKLFKRSIINKFCLRFPDKLNYEDAYWHWTYLTSCKKISCIKNVVYKYYRRKNSIMSNTFERKNNIAIEHLFIVEKIYAFWNKNNNLIEHKKTAISLLEKYFFLSIRYSKNYERIKIAYYSTKIARKYMLYTDNNITIYNIYNGNYNFLFHEKEDTNIIDHTLYLQIMSLLNSIFPKYSNRRKIIYIIARYCYKFIKQLRQ